MSALMPVEPFTLMFKLQPVIRHPLGDDLAMRVLTGMSISSVPAGLLIMQADNIERLREMLGR